MFTISAWDYIPCRYTVAMTIHVESDLGFSLLERWLQNESSLDAFVEAFQQCKLTRQEWTHRAHVGVAASLVVTEGAEEALRCMRATIPRLNESQGSVNTSQSGYHETLTVFWIRILAQFLGRLPARFSRLDKVTAAVEAYGEIRRMDRAFYEIDVLASEQARRAWVAPQVGPSWLNEV